jgi:hypothetical protein
MSLFPTDLPTPNFPKPLDRKDNTSGTVFPNDLIANGRNFYTQIQFVDYNIRQQFNSLVKYANPSGGIKLPLPMKINDTLAVHWSNVSLTSLIQPAAGLAGRAIGGPAGAQVGSAVAGLGLQAAALGGAVYNGGLALNPLMFLVFQRPEYRQFSLSWTLTPRNKKESDTIKNIVTECKKAASPESLAGFLLTYPLVALIRMYPNDIFGHMRFKPCIITSVQASYTGAPVPSFHKNGAPTMVTLTLNLQEMQFWYRSEIE